MQAPVVVMSRLAIICTESRSLAVRHSVWGQTDRPQSAAVKHYRCKNVRLFHGLIGWEQINDGN